MKMINKNLQKGIIFRVICIVLTVLWLMFIFGNSIKTAEESSSISNVVLELVERVSMGVINPTSTGIRKLAHFCEFLILGVLVSLSLQRGRKMSLISTLISVIISILAPLIDETIQLFSNGRGSSVKDVWLDFSGAIFGIAVLYVVEVIIEKAVKNRNKKSRSE